MLSGGLDATYRQALATSHTPYIRVDVLDGAGNELAIPDDRVGEDGGLQFISGSVEVTLTNRVTRTLDITFDEALYPASPSDLLAPYGNRLRVTRGIKFADGTRYAWTVFTGRIQDDASALDGSVAISAMDRANEVVEAQFIQPENSQVGDRVSSEFVRLVSDAVPDASFGTFDLNDITVPLLTWESDRAGALDEMATAAGAYWWALANGDYVIRTYPFAADGPSILTLNEGDGGLLAAAPTRAREQIYNSITVTGERADGTTPVFALSQDLDPASPTYVRGNFGLRHKVISLQTPQTQGSCHSAADSYLRSSIALNQSWTWTQPVDAALELGDVVTLNARGESGIIQVVSGFTIPLDLSVMGVVGRAQVHNLLDTA
jgi:hypothetical protein